MTTFRTYNTSKQLYQSCKQVKAKYYITDQLMRAALSICLNLSEGNQRQTTKDRARFFNYALTSLREVQTIIDLENLKHLRSIADQLGSQIYCLLKRVA